MRKVPPHVARSHPLVTGKYAIHTAAIAAMVDVFAGWIENRISGAYIFGPSRFGKSRAVKWFLKELLEEHFKQSVPLHVWIRPFQAKSPAEFYKLVLTGFRHGYGGNRASGSDRLEILIEFLISSAQACDTNYALLVIDEAQGLTTDEWLWLMAVQNRLVDEGYALSVFAVASHQIAYEFDLLVRTGNPHIAARFLVDQWKFPGVESIEELQFILDGYDEQSRWPVIDGVSYLEHFAPADFKQGRRLGESAPQLWEALVALLPTDYKGPWIFPMKHIALAVEDALFRIASGKDWDDITSTKAWIEALVKHRLSDHMRAISLNVTLPPKNVLHS